MSTIYHVAQNRARGSSTKKTPLPLADGETGAMLFMRNRIGISVLHAQAT